MQKNEVAKSGRELIVPLQKLLEGDYLRVMRLHEDVNSLSPVPHRHDHYGLLYITEGLGTHFINFKEFEVKPERVYFLHPGSLHVIGRFKRNGWLIVFGQELFKRFVEIHKNEDESGILDFYTPCPYVDLNEELTGVFRSVTGLLNVELSTEKQDVDVLLHYTASLLLQLNRAHAYQHPEKAAVSNSKFEFHTLKHLIDNHFIQQHQAEFYSDKMNADIKKLNRICRWNTGFTVAGLLKDRLLTESKILLQTSGSSVKEISYGLGFNDPAFFGRFFKRETGFTPAEFRNMRLI